MLTELQKRKFTALFHRTDLNDNGFFERSDNEEYTRRLCEALNFAPGSPEYDMIHTQTMASWETDVGAADTDKDGRVSLQERLQAYEVTLNDKDSYDNLATQYAHYILGLWDRDGDGRLSADEYVKLVWCYGIEEQDAREALQHLDRSGDGYLSTEEMVTALDEFYFSDDPDAPGNWLFRSLLIGGVSVAHTN